MMNLSVAKIFTCEKRIRLDRKFRWNTISEAREDGFESAGSNAPRNSKEASGFLSLSHTRAFRSQCFIQVKCRDHLRLSSQGSYAKHELFVCPQLCRAACSPLGPGHIIRRSGQYS